MRVVSIAVKLSATQTILPYGYISDKIMDRPISLVSFGVRDKYLRSIGYMVGLNSPTS